MSRVPYLDRLSLPAVAAPMFLISGPRLVIEPGVSMVADSMDYVVRILDSRKAADREVLDKARDFNCRGRHAAAPSVFRVTALFGRSAAKWHRAQWFSEILMLGGGLAQTSCA